MNEAKVDTSILNFDKVDEKYKLINDYIKEHFPTKEFTSKVGGIFGSGGENYPSDGFALIKNYKWEIGRFDPKYNKLCEHAIFIGEIYHPDYFYHSSIFIIPWALEKTDGEEYGSVSICMECALKLFHQV